jgi:hypothetical protein
VLVDFLPFCKIDPKTENMSDKSNVGAVNNVSKRTRSDNVAPYRVIKRSKS